MSTLILKHTNDEYVAAMPAIQRAVLDIVF